MSNIACPQLLSSGVCENPSCPHRHNVFSCDLCGLVCGSLNEYTQHNASKRHLKNARGESGGVVFCPACQKHISGRENWVGHAATTRHKKIVAQMGLSLNIDPEEVESVPSHTLCSTCNTHIQDIFWSHHQITPRHKARERFISFQTALDEAERDKHGVSVLGNFDFGIVDRATAKSGITVRPTIKNTMPSSKVSIVSMTLASDKGSWTQSP
jgi:helicase MOV-10